METYQITMPPRVPGIYLLKNDAAKKFYVGKTVSLYRRFCEWRSAFQAGYGVKSASLFSAVQGTNLDDWVFCIMKEMPSASDADLHAAEGAAVKAFERRGIPTLNTMPVVSPTRAKGVSPAASVAVTYEGNPVTYRQAAELLGCSVKAVSKRAARYKTRGIQNVQLEDWMETSKKYRA